MIITIDGPAASGKTSLSDILSQKINYNILHSGLLYRAIAKKIIDNNISSNDKEQVEIFAEKVTIEDINDHSLGNENIAIMASKISVYDKLREYTNKLQHDFANCHSNVIVEGRDAGTIVFPNADLKIFITASPEVRALRRFKELQISKNTYIYEDVLKQTIERDQRDSSRSNAPLTMASDAVLLDTSDLTKEESLDKLLHIVKTKLL